MDPGEATWSSRLPFVDWFDAGWMAGMDHICISPHLRMVRRMLKSELNDDLFSLTSWFAHFNCALVFSSLISVLQLASEALFVDQSLPIAKCTSCFSAPWINTHHSSPLYQHPGTESPVFRILRSIASILNFSKSLSQVPPSVFE